MKRLLTTENGPQAELIRSRLQDAGITALMHGGGLAAYTQESGTQEIYVEDADLERAREVLKPYEDISEQELVEAEEEAASDPPDTRLIQPIGTDPRTGRPYKPIEVRAHKRSLWDRIFKREAKETP